MNVPNTLTISRIAATPVICVLMTVGAEWSDWLAFGLFLYACVTDYLDGYMARVRGKMTSLGRILDPIADKLLVGIVMITLVGINRVEGMHIIAVALVIARELLVSGLREQMAEFGTSVPVTRLAKWKTATQMIALGLLVLGPAGPAGTVELGIAALWAAAALTLVTGWAYLRVSLSSASADDRAAGDAKLESADPAHHPG